MASKEGEQKRAYVSLTAVGEWANKGVLDKKEEGANYWEPAVRERPAGIYFPMILVFIPTLTRFFWSRLLGSRVAGSEASLFLLFFLSFCRRRESVVLLWLFDTLEVPRRPRPISGADDDVGDWLEVFFNYAAAMFYFCCCSLSAFRYNLRDKSLEASVFCFPEFSR